MTALAEYELLEADGRFFDGRTAQARDVVVKFGDASLIVTTLEGVPITHWPLASLRSLDPKGPSLTLIPDHDSDERLTVDDELMMDAIRKVCPDLGRRRPVPRKRWRRVAFWTVAALVSVYLIIFQIVPSIADQMAELIPPEAEVAMGEKLVDEVAAFLSKTDKPGFCVEEAGAAALAKLSARMEAAAASHVPLTVRVLKYDMVNAFALPGGQIVIFDGLLKKADSPEEVAGVLAHEIAHVVNRDPTRLTLRSAGAAGVLGLLLGDFTGAGATVIVAETVMRSGYQREAESAADDFALALISRQGLPTAPLGGFFRKLGEAVGETESWLSHLATHPDLARRADRADAADRVGAAPFTPALTDQEWVALVGICDRTE